MPGMVVQTWEAGGIADGRISRLIHPLNPQPRISKDLVIIHGEAIPVHSDKGEFTVEQCLVRLCHKKPGMSVYVKECFRIHTDAEGSQFFEYRGTPGMYWPRRPKQSVQVIPWRTPLRLTEVNARMNITFTQTDARALGQLTQDDLANSGCASIAELRQRLQKQNYHWSDEVWVWLWDFTTEVTKPCC